MKPNKTKLTNSIVRRFEGDGTDRKIWDTEASGLHLRITPAGSKSYAFAYRNLYGDQRTIRIGRAEAMTVSQARLEARSLRVSVDQGRDPSRERSERRNAPTLACLFDVYMEQHAIPKKKPRSVEEDQRLWRLHLQPYFASIKVKCISIQEIRKRHSEMSSKPGAANRMLALLSKMLSVAIENDWRQDNPCLKIHRYPERRIERFLSTEEIGLLKKSLDVDEDRCAAIAIEFLLMTGVRLNEALNAKWVDLSNIGLDNATFTLRGGGQKGERGYRSDVILPIMPAASWMLLNWRKSTEESEWVFPSERKLGGRRQCIKKAWRRIRSRALLDDVRLHDLRHTFASVAINAGVPLAAIGGALNHRDARTTQRYAHLNAETVRGVGIAVQKALGR